jgi:hypothetical protein
LPIPPYFPAPWGLRYFLKYGQKHIIATGRCCPFFDDRFYFQLQKSHVSPSLFQKPKVHINSNKRKQAKEEKEEATKAKEEAIEDKKKQQPQTEDKEEEATKQQQKSN